MKLDLSASEFIALFLFLDRPPVGPLQDVYAKMNNTLIDIIDKSDESNQMNASMFDSWARVQEKKVEDLRQDNEMIRSSAEVFLGLDPEDNDPPRRYPRRTLKKKVRARKKQ